MKKIYLVDSENVGDVWVPLLASSQPEDEVLVFYTQKSPHMSYENVRMLKETDRKAVFIKCFEGSNALDFQLVSELGFRLSHDSESEYIIISNDTGFDAAVRYWSVRKMPVSRLSGKECYRNLVAKKQRAMDGETTPSEDATANGRTVTEADSAAAGPTESEERPDSQTVSEENAKAAVLENTGEDAKAAALESTGEDAKAAALESTGEDALSDAEETQTDSQEDLPEDLLDEDTIVKKLFCCISKENLVDFHNALVAFLGEEKGKALYQEIKGNAEYTAYWAGLPVSSQREKFEIYCPMVFAYSDFANDVPEDFAGFLYQTNGKRKNLNSLRAALQGHYGKDKGMKYYSLFKSHIKIMNRM